MPVFLAYALATPLVALPPVAPCATLRGDAPLVDAARAALRQRGVELGACSEPQIEVRGEPGGFSVQIRGAGRPAIQRQTAELSLAVMFIESWLRDDLTAPLMERNVPLSVVRPAPGDVETSPVVPRRDSAPPARPFTVGVGPVLGAGDDGSLWSGIDLRGCVRAGPACVGGRARWAVDLETGGESARLSGSREAFDVLLTAELPVTVGSFEFGPGLGVGVGVVRTERRVEGVLVEDDVGGPKLRGQLALAWRVSAQWALRLDVALDYAPLAHRQVVESLVDEGPPNVPLAGEPALLGWLQASVELGGL